MNNKKDETNTISNNGYDIILNTYNSHKYPVIENQMNALVFPWSMQRDVDAIDTMKFYEGTDAVNKKQKNK
ncbi:hypothetical protein [Brassicibacter mesophilus]|uniref:hypothetical protein n=1 Tax=Brassicibacter mesophilus TaxID=745119 RepID=UPI003D23577A